MLKLFTLDFAQGFDFRELVRLLLQLLFVLPTPLGKLLLPGRQHRFSVLFPPRYPTSPLPPRTVFGTPSPGVIEKLLGVCSSALLGYHYPKKRKGGELSKADKQRIVPSLGNGSSGSRSAGTAKGARSSPSGIATDADALACG